MHPVLLLAVSAILIPAGAPHHGGVIAGQGLSITGVCPGNPGICEFTAGVQDPSLIYFRWDLNGDGIFDVPYQAGGGPFGRWSTDVTISFTASAGGRRMVCAQGWDGVRARGVAPDRVPVGPVVCKVLLLGGNFTVTPASWDVYSTGSVFASWSVPAGFSPHTSVPRVTTIAGVPATPVPTLRIPGSSLVTTFEVDRAALTAALGPGAHNIRLWGVWDEGTFSVWGGVEFSADGQVTIT